MPASCALTEKGHLPGSLDLRGLSPSPFWVSAALLAEGRSGALRKPKGQPLMALLVCNL